MDKFNICIDEKELRKTLAQIKTYTVDTLTQSNQKPKQTRIRFNTIIKTLQPFIQEEESKTSLYYVKNDQIQKIDMIDIITFNIFHNNVDIHSAKYIACMKNLTNLDIGMNHLGPEGAEIISSIKQLVSLNISTNQLGPQGAYHISTMKQLVSLSIGYNDIGPDGSKYISQLESLTTLDVCWNEITNQGFEYLTSLQHLKTLNVSANKIDTINSIPSTINSLDMSHNQLDSTSVKHILVLKNLIYLNLKDNDIRGDESYFGDMNKLRHLDLSNTNIIKASTTPRYLALETMTSITSISKIKKLQTLVLHGNHIPKQGAIYIAKLHFLHILDLGCCNIGSEGVEYISHLPCLTNLDVSYNNIGSEGAKFISQMSTLYVLTISGNNFGDEGIRLIVESLPHLIKLEANNKLASIYRNHGTGNDTQIYKIIKSLLSPERKQQYKLTNRLTRLEYEYKCVQACINTISCYIQSRDDTQMFSDSYSLQTDFALVVVKDIILRQLAVLLSTNQHVKVDIHKMSSLNFIL